VEGGRRKAEGGRRKISIKQGVVSSGGATSTHVVRGSLEDTFVSILFF
jgi:hypothetical protein